MFQETELENMEEVDVVELENTGEVDVVELENTEVVDVDYGRWTKRVAGIPTFELKSSKLFEF